MLVEKSRNGFRATVPCKVNLFLEVLGRRSDGYHDLDTVMMAASLCDELEVYPAVGGELELSIVIEDVDGRVLPESDPAWSIPSDKSNLVVRALDRLRISQGKPNAGATIRLTKRVPVMAGLGGGSANAAAALVLGSLLWSNQNDFRALRQIASELGSDVNFFLEANHDSYWVARCTGRGERILPLECVESLHLVILKSPEGCKTAEVFANHARQHDLQLLGYAPPLVIQSPDSLIKALAMGDSRAVGRALTNRLEEAAAKTTSWVQRSAKCFDRYDHLGQCLSGSGSARFCLCSDAPQAEEIVSLLNSRSDMRAYYAQSWRSPSIDSQIQQLRNDS